MQLLACLLLKLQAHSNHHFLHIQLRYMITSMGNQRVYLPFQFLAACRLVSIFNDRLFLVVECALSFIWDELRHAITIFLARKACRSLTFSHFLKFTFNVSSNFHCQFKFFTLHSCFIF